MGFLQRLFGKPPTEPPLPPLHDPALGKLIWDEDSEGWTGSVAAPGGAARVYIGAGAAHEYPSEELLILLREPYRQFQELSRTALAYLLANANLKLWSAAPEAFRVEGLESYAHYLPEGTYTVTFTNGESEAIWKVHFQNLEPQGCGVDG
jgi:hypothetical protein